MDRKDEILRSDYRIVEEVLADQAFDELSFSQPYQFNDNDLDGKMDEFLL